MSDGIEGQDTDVGGVGEVVGGAPPAPEVVVLRARLLQAELKAEAIRAGMVDLDGVKLIEASALRVNDAGELMDGPGVMRALRAAKPWLFGGSSSSAALAPRAEPPRVKRAMEMSVDEWRLARAELLRRR